MFITLNNAKTQINKGKQDALSKSRKFSDTKSNFC